MNVDKAYWNHRTYLDICHMRFSEETWIKWMDRLSEDDVVVIDDFITEADFATVMAFFSTKLAENKLLKAAIGSSNRLVDETIRGDYTYWLDQEQDVELKPIFDLLDEAIQKLNRYCYLGLTGSEFHLAHYPEGTFYKKHLDQFKEKSTRVISFIIYLNENWKKGDGGELKVFQDGGDYLIQPLARRCVLFKSGTVPHEVQKTNVSRYSLTGWLRRDY